MKKLALSKLGVLFQAAILSIVGPAYAQIDPVARGLAIKANSQILVNASSLTQLAPEYVKASTYGLSTLKTDNTAFLQAAITAAANGTGQVSLPCGTFNISKPLVVTTKVTIGGQSEYCTILNYTGTTGTAISFSPSYPTSSIYGASGFGLHDLSLIGPGQTNTATVGLMVGNTTGSNINTGAGFVANHIRVRGFGIGMTWGSAVWDTLVSKSLFDNNAQALVFPNGLTNAGEQITFTDNLIVDNGFFNGYQACIEVAGGVSSLEIKGGSIDDCQVYVHSSGANVVLSNLHLEFPGLGSNPRLYPYVNNLGGSVTLRDIDLTISGSAASTVPLFVANYTNPITELVISGLHAFQQTVAPIPSLVMLGGAANLIEWGTKTPYCGNTTRCYDSFAINTGTGRAIVTTPPSFMYAGATSTIDPQGVTAASSTRYTDPTGFGGATNLLFQSNALTTSPWQAFCNAGTSSSTDFTDPWGGTSETVWKLTSLSAPAGSCNTTQAGFYQNLSHLKNSTITYVASAWVKTATGTQSFFMGPGQNVQSFTATTSWQRFSYKVNGDASARAFALYLEPNGSTTGGHTVYVCCTSLAPGSTPPAYAETTTTQFWPIVSSDVPASLSLTTLGSASRYTTFNANGYMSTTGTAPVLDMTSNSGASCGGTGATDTGSSDQAGTVTLGSTATTSCTLTWSSPLPAQPVCLANDSQGGSVIPSPTTTGLTVTFSGSRSGTSFSYICIGKTS